MMDASDQFPLNLRALSAENLLKLVGPIPQFAVDVKGRHVLFQPTAKSNPHWIWNFLSHLRLLDVSVSDMMKNVASNKRPQYFGQKYVTIEERDDFYATDDTRRKYDFADPSCILMTLIQYGHMYYTSYIVDSGAVNSTWSSSEQLVASCRQLEHLMQSLVCAVDGEHRDANPELIHDAKTTQAALNSCRALLLSVPKKSQALSSALAELQSYELHCRQIGWRASLVLNNVIPITFPFDYDDGTSGVYAAGTNVLFYHMSDELQAVVRESARVNGLAEDDVNVGIGEGRASSVQADISISGWRTAGKGTMRAKKSKQRGKAPAEKPANKAEAPKPPITDDRLPSGRQGDRPAGTQPGTKKQSSKRGQAGRRTNTVDGLPPGLFLSSEKVSLAKSQPWIPKVRGAPPEAQAVDFRDAWKNDHNVESHAPPVIVDFRDAWESPAAVPPPAAATLPDPAMIVDFRDAWKNT